MRRRLVLIVGGVLAALVGLAVVFLFVVMPAGASTSTGAVIEHLAERGDRGSTKVLTQRDWGDGQLILAGYERRGVRRLGLAFAVETFRGWRVASYTDEPVEPDDVVVGSLLVASSAGGKGQPPWSAAIGELLDARIDRVEVKWSSGATSFGPRVNDSYLVVEKGRSVALEARFLSKESDEIAKVPISSDDA